MILRPRYVARFRDVATVLIRHGFADVLALLDLSRFIPGHRHVAASPEERERYRAESLRQALEELGPAYIKLGQLLSTRPDILPDAFLGELQSLQDRVPPFPFEAVRTTLKEELQRPLEEVFSRFEETPVASGSLSQVHRAEIGDATGGNSRSVAVKVLRPGIEREIETDIDILEEVAAFVSRSAIGQRYDLRSIAEQLRRTLTDELDLRREARNARHFAATLAEHGRLRVPAVIDELTTARVYVAEFMDGLRLLDLDSARHEPETAEQLWKAYLKEILVDGLFQCDPHPGNFLLLADGKLALLDHGMVAHLTRATQVRLLSLLLALAGRDGEEVAESCIEIGIPGPSFRERVFVNEIGLMVARYTGLPLHELNLGALVMEIARIAFTNDIQIPSEMMLLGKTLLNLDGVCRRLDPKMDPVAIMRNAATSLLARQLTRDVTRTQILYAGLQARALASEIPASVRRILRRAARNDIRVGLKLEGSENLQSAIQKVAGRITLGLITAALIVGSAMLFSARAGSTAGGFPVFALAGFLLAAGLGIYLVVKIILLDRY